MPGKGRRERVGPRGDLVRCRLDLHVAEAGVGVVCGRVDVEMLLGTAVEPCALGQKHTGYLARSPATAARKLSIECLCRLRGLGRHGHGCKRQGPSHGGCRLAQAAGTAHHRVQLAAERQAKVWATMKAPSNSNFIFFIYFVQCCVVCVWIGGGPEEVRRAAKREEEEGGGGRQGGGGCKSG